ncbi:MAG: hypothetical protein ACI4VQ_06310 [Clostridia bacterium]
MIYILIDKAKLQEQAKKLIHAYLSKERANKIINTVNPIKAITFIAFFLILQQIEGNLIYPRIRK